MPVPNSAEEILSRRGGGLNVSGFVGQILTIVSFEEDSGQFGKYVHITALNSEGDEVVFQTGSVGVIEKIEALQEFGLLPTEVRVTSFDTRFGTSGYDFEPINATA